MEKQNTALGEKIRSAIILVLCICLFAFSMLFVLLKLTGGTSVLPELPKAHLLQLSSSDSSQKGNSGYIVPTFCAVIIDGEGYALPYDSEIRGDFMKKVSPYLSRALSGSCTVIERGSRGWEETYAKIFDLQNAYHLRFEYDIPAFCISALLEHGSSYESANAPILFNNVFICYDSNLSVMVYTVNSHGDIALLRPENDLPFNKDDFLAYNSIGGLYDFDFYSAGSSSEFKIGVFSESVPIKDAVIWDFSQRFDLSEQSAGVVNILESFTFNPNNTNRYLIKDESVGYVEASGELIITDGGHISYIGTEQGIELYSFGAMQDRTVFEECIHAASSVLSNLDKDYFGKDAQIGILQTYVEDEKLYVEFGYYLDGVAIEDKRLVFVFSSNGLVGAELDALVCNASAEKSFDIPQSLSIAAVTMQEREVLATLAKYTVYAPLADRVYGNELDGNNTIASARWVFFAREEVSAE